MKASLILIMFLVTVNCAPATPVPSSAEEEHAHLLAVANKISYCSKFVVGLTKEVYSTKIAIDKYKQTKEIKTLAFDLFSVLKGLGTDGFYCFQYAK